MRNFPYLQVTHRTSNHKPINYQVFLKHADCAYSKIFGRETIVGKKNFNCG